MLDEKVANIWLNWWAKISGCCFSTEQYAITWFDTMAHKPKCWIADTSFFKRLTPKQQYDYASVRRWTKQIAVYELDRLIFPVLIETIPHFLVVVLNTKAMFVEVYDSMKSKNNSVPLHADKLILRWFADEVLDKGKKYIDVSRWPVFHQDVPQQQNGLDCGIFMLLFAASASVSMRPKFQFTQKSIPDIRKWITYCAYMCSEDCDFWNHSFFG